MPGIHSLCSTALPSQSPSEENSGDESCDACAELFRQLEIGGLARCAALEALTGSIAELAFDASACRVVQKAFDVGEVKDTAPLARELMGRVGDAMRSPHANHVLQKIVTLLPVADIQFVIDELHGVALEFSRQRFGCRVLCRLVEKHGAQSLVDEILPLAAELVRHVWGHHVINSILEHGSATSKEMIWKALRPELEGHAKNRYSTHVVMRALACCTADMQQDLAMTLFGTSEALVSLTENQFGCQVAKLLLRMQGNHINAAAQHIDTATPELQQNKHGRRFLEELKRVWSQSR